jgi:lysozyme
MRTNAAGVALIKRLEGLRLRAYRCEAGKLTIGWGHTGDVKETDVISEHQAEAILDADLDKYERMVAGAVKVPLNENQFAALVSFAFNVGPGRKANPAKGDKGKDGFLILKSGVPPTILRKLNAQDFAGAAAEFMKWKYAAGQVSAGIVKRRAAERALFVKPVVRA